MTSLDNNIKTAISLIDLTSLTNVESTQDIINLCQQAKSEGGNTAAICIYPRFVPVAKKQLLAQETKEIKIATVTNFPDGGDDIAIAVAETKAAVAYGADEVDVVFPYKALMAGNESVGFELVKACKEACGKSAILKVIIESGELATHELIKLASEISINAGADFIKTSTGKVAINATPDAAKTMLEVIASLKPSVGFKAAGGVKNIDDVNIYLTLAKEALGDKYISENTFRFGASSLLPNLLAPSEDANSASQGY